jgi:hypothetical protein
MRLCTILQHLQEVTKNSFAQIMPWRGAFEETKLLIAEALVGNSQ